MVSKVPCILLRKSYCKEGSTMLLVKRNLSSFWAVIFLSSFPIAEDIAILNWSKGFRLVSVPTFIRILASSLLYSI